MYYLKIQSLWVVLEILSINNLELKSFIEMEYFPTLETSPVLNIAFFNRRLIAFYAS